MTTVEVETQPRIDTVVRLPDGREARHTEYAGTAWFDGKPVIRSGSLSRPRNAPWGIRNSAFSTSFFVPDSLPYQRSGLGDATLSASVTLRASGGEHDAVVRAAAIFTDDPSGAPTWIQLHIRGNLGWPAGIGYRIVALTPPEAVR
ncbi:hypothetical protein [Mycobacterium deserti]|uniref:DUF3237 domain-containing protein n=1 Tax=Mycobacterium deserti TaxID=2978347 RepID=A0ABT2MBH7_9MYCO|nr:hypothetical protein [Mycobacterium deserti]MCT7659615.1 hypothetical protein [Mycobacterium deserti]